MVDLRSMTLPSMSLLTAHFDGTVNLFSFEMGVEDVTFTDMGNLVHEVRCSGHRYGLDTSTPDYFVFLICFCLLFPITPQLYGKKIEIWVYNSLAGSKSSCDNMI